MSNNTDTTDMTHEPPRRATPRLRFPEFRDAGAWEEKRLEQISEIRTGPFGSVLHESDYVNIGTPIITVEHLDELGIKGKDFPRVSDLDKVRLSAYQLQEGDIVFSRVGSVDRSSIVGANEDGWLFSGRLLRLRMRKPKENSPQFLNQLLKHEHSKAKIRNRAVGQTMPSLNTEILNGISFHLPYLIEEQRRIADCLASLDDLIAAHSAKLNALRAHKKGLMQQLFPAEGETVPRLRFPEFRDAGAWEVKKLWHLAEKFLDGDWIESKDQSSEGIRLIQTGNIGIGEFIPKHNSARYVSEETFNRLKCTEVFPGDCLISRLPDPIGRSSLVPNIGQRMITAVDCTIVRFNRQQIVPYLFVLYAQTNQYFDKVNSLGSGSTRTRISRENLSQVQIPFPRLPEQERIASFFASLDDLIAAQSQKLDALKAHKKGLMQQLFPSADEVQG